MAKEKKKNYETPAPLSNNVTLNRGSYTIWKKMASGGFGVVYMASKKDGTIVAIKEFLPQSLVFRKKDEKMVEFKKTNDRRRFNEGLQSFWKEADNLMKLRNPRIVPIWDMFEENGTAYFTMPLLPGQSFYTSLRGRLPEWEPSAVRDIFIEACLGIEVLHEVGLLHLDIKPGNLWLTPENKVIVFDLGASHWEDEAQTQAHLARTPGYAAPEQHQHLDKRILSEATDVYGLAASMYTFLAQESPLPAPERIEEKEKYKYHKTALSRILFRSINMDLAEIIDKGMDLEQANRYKTMRTFRKALQDCPRLYDIKSLTYRNDTIQRYFTQKMNTSI
jgi:eukaryotic-like serine/threonine-protein kinase